MEGDLLRAVARNQIGRGPFVLVSMGSSPLVIAQGMTREDYYTALDELMNKAGIIPDAPRQRALATTTTNEEASDG